MLNLTDKKILTFLRFNIFIYLDLYMILPCTSLYKRSVQTVSHSPCECVIKNYFSYLSTKTYVVGTPKNRLMETVLLIAQNIC